MNYYNRKLKLKDEMRGELFWIPMIIMALQHSEVVNSSIISIVITTIIILKSSKLIIHSTIIC